MADPQSKPQAFRQINSTETLKAAQATTTSADAALPYAEHTPVMRQYLMMRDENPGVLLLYRLGDFYETFFEDAVRLNKLLGLTLTHRGKDNQGRDIPMAGVPASTLEQYLARLVRAGVSVAICEQIGDAQSARGMMQRKIVRIVTPGTITDNSLLSEKVDSTLAAWAPPKGRNGSAALVWLTLSSGEFCATRLAGKSLAGELARVAPSELLVPDAYRERFSEDAGATITALPDWHFDAQKGAEEIRSRFGLEGLVVRGLENEPSVLAAANAILGYVEQTQREALPYIRPLSLESDTSFIVLDAATRRNLEISETLRGDDGPTLLSVLDACRTSMGSRTLRRWLHNPLRDALEVRARHDAVQDLIDMPQKRELLADALNNFPDIERIAGRIALRSIRPKELAALRDALPQLQAMVQILCGFKAPLLQSLMRDLHVDAALFADLERTLLPEPAPLLRDGEVIRSEASAELAQLRAMRDNAGGFLMELELREKQATGIASLRVEFNRVSGYYIEVPRGQAANVPDRYRRRQTLKNVERFVTPELKEFEDKALSAKERCQQLERSLWDALLARAAVFVKPLMQAAAAVSRIDVLETFARHAVGARWCRPQIDDSPGIELAAARHPVVEHMFEHYVPNDCRLVPGRRLLIITGPNMGGKSTYMRSVALIALLAYAGSFVPATSARLGPIDKILTRIGASDDLARGRSTFMVEMTEAAAILHQATENSLVLMDEIGRGTSTFDGLSLAAAIARELVENTRSWTLFATHYFELTQLTSECPEAANIHVCAQETKKGIVFLHNIEDGPANQSYGIAVANLAGVPARVIRRARGYLSELETRALRNGPQLDLFAAGDLIAETLGPEPGKDEPLSDEMQALKDFAGTVAAIDADALSPRQALEVLYELKQKALALECDSQDDQGDPSAQGVPGGA